MPSCTTRIACDLLVVSGPQLKALNVCTGDEMEKLGRWSKGSSMPDTYDNQAGVSELTVRHKILNELRKGWRPVDEGNLPLPLSSTTSVPLLKLYPYAVDHAKRKRYTCCCQAVGLLKVFQFQRSNNCSGSQVLSPPLVCCRPLASNV